MGGGGGGVGRMESRAPKAQVSSGVGGMIHMESLKLSVIEKAFSAFREWFSAICNWLYFTSFGCFELNSRWETTFRAIRLQ